MSKSKFKIGDEVTIPKDVDKSIIQGSFVSWNSNMSDSLGKTIIVSHEDDGDGVIMADGWWWPVEVVKRVGVPAKAKPWQELAGNLAAFTYSDGSKLSWRKIAEMTGKSKSTVSDFLRKGV